MPDDFSWFFAGENRRANMLRDELEGLQRTAYASSAQSARLSSQLRTLQGSMESRLQALSTAFDAYVELGDVREQLAGYPDTSAIRRDTLKGLVVLAQGGVPDRVDGRGVDYWLVDATNEVIDLASGPSRSTGARGPSSQERETFVVAALGWLGHGDRVAGRVAPLLVADGALATPQVLLWRAAAHGLLGDVLDAVRSAWQHDLDLAGPTWEHFAAEAARAATPVETLRWVRDLLDGEWAPARDPEVPGQDDRAALRSLVDALVGAGLADERVLLERARVLRARIEDPGAREADPRTEPPRTPTTVLVQQALLDPDVVPGTRRALAVWVRPGLEAAVAGIAARVAAEQPDPVVARTEMGDAEVGTEGVDPARLAQLDAIAVQRWSNPRGRLLAPGVAAGIVLVVGLVLVATQAGGLGGLGVFLLVVAVVLAGVLVRELLRVRSRRAELVATQRRVRERVEHARVAAVTTRAASEETKAQVADLARAITGSEVAVGPSLR